MKLHVVGIDFGKTVFHLVGLDSTGRVAIRKKCSRKQLLAFATNLQVQLIGIESYTGVDDSTEGRIHWRRPTAIARYSLATLRRTVHSDNTQYKRAPL